MSKTSFTVFSRSQNVEFDQSEHFEGSFDSLRSSLKFFFMFHLQMPSTVTQLSLVFLNIRLKLYNPGVLLAQTTVPFGMTCDKKEWKQGLWIEFILDKDAIHSIENTRQGDVRFIVEMNGLFSYSGGSFPEGGYTNEVAHPFQVVLPKSEWVEKILPKLGYETFKLLEIPFTHSSLNEAYDDILDEFNQAEEYYNKNDYNKCVAHCRHTLDALRRNLKKIKETGNSETGFQWLKITDEATFNWIDELDKANSLVTGKTHHSGLKRKFERFEAESIYLVTLGLLNYVAHLKKELQA